jgi:hypothetical protein
MMRVAGMLAAVLVVGCDVVTPSTSPTGSPASTTTGEPSGDSRLGLGETLIVLVAGTYPTRAEAEAGAAAMRLGDGLGFYVDEARNYQARAIYSIEEDSLRYRGAPGQFIQWPESGWLALTAFRTRAGAQSLMPRIRFAELEVQAWQVVKLGGVYVGLGNEAHPDGSGLLIGPLPEQERYQR